MLKFVDYGPVMTAPPPIICEGADLYVFALDADFDRLDGLCKTAFNVPTKNAVRCGPIGPQVVLIFGRIDKVKGAGAGPGDLGHDPDRRPPGAVDLCPRYVRR